MGEVGKENAEEGAGVVIFFLLFFLCLKGFAYKKRE